MKTADFAFVKDAFVPADKAVLPVSDLAVQRGYGIFDYVKTVNNRIVFEAEHLKRFYHSAAEMGLPVSMPPAQMSDLLQQLVKKNNMDYAGIRITLTGGASPDGYTLSDPCLIITQQKLQPPAPSDFEKGIRLITYQHQRQLPHVKTIDYLMAVRLQSWIRENGADDVLYHQKGIISECPRANFFLVTKDGAVVTPAHNILHGITRSKLLLLASSHVRIEGNVTLEDVSLAREAFITSTTKAILPVTHIDGKEINGGAPGPITREIKRIFNAQ